MGVVVMFAALQRQLIYYPELASEASLLEAAQRINLQGWRNSSGQLIGWRTPAPAISSRRVVVFHGNAGHALYRLYFAAGFLAQSSDWQVYLFEYPGYGARPGKPSETDIKAAATDAIAELLAQDASPVYLVGESLGSGVATYLAGAFGQQIAGILLVTPFTSLTDVASEHYGFLPVRTLLSERYDSLNALEGYQGPVAFLLAGNDEIVPAALGRRLYESYGGPKWLQEEPGAGHNSLSLEPSQSWWSEVAQFWQTADDEL
jgi:pimeloyl-ACP methyl ester carboxylesterase